jgi:hypothetical protein
MTTIFFSPLSFVAVFGSGIRDPGSEIRDPRSGFRDGKKSGSGIRDKHPGSATLVLTLEYVHCGPDLDLEKHNRLDPTL